MDVTARHWPYYRLLLLGFAVYVATAAPTVSWFDTGELTVQAFSLGNGHPPGQPLFAITGHGSRFLPIGSLPFRLSLLAGLQAALCLPLLFSILHQWFTLVGRVSPRWIELWVAGLGLSLPLWMQAVRVELYALHLLLTLGLVWIATSVQIEQMRRQKAEASPSTHSDSAAFPAAFSAAFLGRWRILALMMGLALCNHHLLVVLAVPGLLCLLGIPPRRILMPSVLAGVLGLSVYLQSPIRSQAGALLDWGQPDTFSRWWDVVTARAYQRSFVHLGWHHVWTNLGLHLRLFAQVLGEPLLFLASAGLVALRHRPPLLAGVLLLVGGNLVATVGQTVFFPDNPDALGYLALSVLLVGGLAALGLEVILSATPLKRLWSQVVATRRPLIAGGIALTLALLPASRAWPLPDLHGQWSQSRFGSRLMSSLPLGASFFTSADGTTFSAWYQQVIRQHRLDVRVVSAYSLPGPGAVRGISSPLPAASPPLPPDHPAQKWANIPGTLEVATALETALASGPVVVSALDLPLELTDRLRPAPAGFLLQKPDVAPPNTLGLDETLRFWQDEQSALVQDAAWRGDRQGRLLYAAPLEAVGDTLLEQGQASEALTVYRLVQQFDPDPLRLVRLKRQQLEAQGEKPIVEETRQQLDAQIYQAWQEINAGRYEQAYGISQQVGRQAPVYPPGLRLAGFLNRQGLR